MYCYRNNQIVREIAPFENEKAQRDILYFIEEQSGWGYLYGDISFGYTLNLPYWDYLDLRGGMNQETIDFLRTYSLVVITSMCLEKFEEKGSYLLYDDNKRSELTTAIHAFIPPNPAEAKIINVIKRLLECLDKDAMEYPKELENDELQWMYIKYIYGFYRAKFHSFDSHLEGLYRMYEK